MTKLLNDNHWYIIAFVLACSAIFYTYGCESQVCSLVDESKKVNRSGLQNELNYIIGLAKVREEDLDKQDAVKQSLIDAANIMSTEGSINPSGLINLAATIGGISFGLTQRQKLKDALKKTPINTA
jgi:hypothetical protein